MVLDASGWALIDDLLRLTGISRDSLDEVVLTNDKQRFVFSPDGKRIRASQGHSLSGIHLGLQPKTPPDLLYHGTVSRFLGDILAQGLMRMQRHHVHLSETKETAHEVGARRGDPVLLTVDARAMAQDGQVFYRSDNGVWLTDNVPTEYLS